MHYTSLPDHILIQECRAGNVKAFDVLFGRYFNKLHHFTIKYIKDELVAEEMVMDIMFRLWLKQEELTSEISLAPYLFKAIKNGIIDHYRKRQLSVIPIDERHDDVYYNCSTDQNLAFDELHMAYQINLKRLSPQRRKIFEMSREENMTYSQIAKSLNLSVKTVESHMSAALVVLRKNLHIYTDTFLLILFISSKFK